MLFDKMRASGVRRIVALAWACGVIAVAVWLVSSGDQAANSQQPVFNNGNFGGNNSGFNSVPQKSAAEWQKAFPFKSVTEQLEYEKERAKQTPPAVTAPPLTKESAKKLDDMDRVYTAPGPFSAIRRESLKALHSKEADEFVKRPGNGLERMPRPSVRFLTLGNAPTLPLGTVSYPESVLASDPKATLPPKNDPKGHAASGADRLPSLESLIGLHGTSNWNFVSPDSLGYAKDGKVAGFDPHKFRYEPHLHDLKLLKHDPKEAAQEHWVLKKLELVSLLKHDKPLVYVSDELPKMENLKNAPTRPLDGFETVALKQLQAGEDVVTDASLNRIRMLGSLRANKGCLECHTAQRGQLLGVFTYEILRDPPILKK
jgi:hypothetical protein